MYSCSGDLGGDLRRDATSSATRFLPFASIASFVSSSSPEAARRPTVTSTASLPDFSSSIVTLASSACDPSIAVASSLPVEAAVAVPSATALAEELLWNALTRSDPEVTTKDARIVSGAGAVAAALLTSSLVG